MKIFQQYKEVGIDKFKLATSQHVIMSHSSCAIVDHQKGIILTNEHVVHGITEYDHFEMQIAGKKDRIPLKLVGMDKETDLAVLKVVEEKYLPLVASSIVWADSEKIAPGEMVITIGYPGRGYEIAQDTYFWNATFGIVSGLVRNESLTEFIQTTANTDKGYSGGGVFNLRGECLGITSEAEGRGLNFAITSNLVKRIVDEILTYGRVLRGGIGTVWDEVKWMRPIDAVEIGLTIEVWQRFIDKGLAVLRVAPGSAAEKAGITPGDIVLRIDGQPAVWSAGMQRYIGSKKPGEVVSVEVFRAKENRNLEFLVRLGDRDEALAGLED